MMVFPEGILSIPLEVFMRLKNWWDEREKRKGIKEQFLNTLEIQIENYYESFNELSRIGKEEVIPLLDSIKIGPTNIQLNQFLRIYTKIVDGFSRIIASFVDLAKGCQLVSLNPAFMGDLKEASSFLYDFVVRMGDMVGEDDVVAIDDKFYTFLKLYEKEFTKDIKAKDIEKTVEYMKPYISKTKNVIAPSIARRVPRRKTSKKIVKSFRSLRRTTKQLKIEAPTIKLENYIPDKLHSITILLEEISEIQP